MEAAGGALECAARRGGRYGGASRKPGGSRDGEPSWGAGDDETPRASGLRMGSLVPRLDVDRGVPVVDLRDALGGVFAYGLGVVRLSGLKL